MVVAVAGTVVVAVADADEAVFVLGKAPMTASAPFRSLLLFVLLLAPAGRASPADPPASTLPPLLPSSSVGAVLLKRSALELTPEQVKQLEQVQARLVRDQAAARDAAIHPPEPSGPANAPPPPKATGAGGGGPGPGMSGGKTRPPPNIRTGGANQSLALEQRLDELDTEAFLKAVELLPEAQREKAVDVASRYREQLFEQREREKKR